MKSYSFGLLQTKAFKALKGYTATLLEPHNITTYEWALLGLLCEASAGLGTTQLAKELEVSKPFVTKTVQSLVSKGWIEVADVPSTDLRNTSFILTADARAKVPEIDKHLRTEMRSVLSGISKLQLLAYVMVLKHISKKLEKSVDDSAFEVSAGSVSRAE